ncbi:MAG: SDR family NAD(P)-dependent oxidoreductase, partial [Actinobacteria bacterium]|nr:SDR family NAD(P)-dependent oxidoreductase [Actinomycetota bacterium]
MGRLQDKVCVITGAGGGMGEEAARVFSAEGAKVVAADVDAAAAERVAGEVGGLGVQVDVAEESSVEAMYAAAAGLYGGIDVLYNNAGISPADDDSILDTSLEAWERVQAVNTRGVYL